MNNQVLDQSGNKSKDPACGRLQALTSVTKTLDGSNVASLVDTRPKTVGNCIHPQMQVGKYVPPHLRKEELPLTKHIIKNKSRLQSEDDNILHTNSGKTGSELQSSPLHDIIGISNILGGCADPTLIEDSIYDPICIPNNRP